MIAVIRSLGRANYKVHAISSDPNALGFQSNYTYKSEVAPQYHDPIFINWLREYISSNNIKLIIPSEGFVLAIMDSFNEFTHLLPLSSNLDIINKCFSKCGTFKSFISSSNNKLRLNIPMSTVIDSEGYHEQVSKLAHAEYPLFAKTDASGALGHMDGVVIKIQSHEELSFEVKELLKSYSQVLIQEAVSGVKVGVNILIEDGVVIAKSMCLARHENPHQGGFAALRTTWWHESIYQDALLRVQTLRWHGVAMMEYKWDKATDNFYFLEMNARFWGYLHLDLYAGVNYPKFQADRFFQEKPTIPSYQINSVICRYEFPADFGYVVSILKDDDVKMMKKLITALNFFILFFNPWVRSDLYFPGDRSLYWTQMKRHFLLLFNSVFAK